MITKLKTLARNAMPQKYQVPVKYWYGAVRRQLEPEMALLEKLVRPGDHVLDVGGNRGTYAHRFFKLGARLDIFEPNPTCSLLLQSWSADKPVIKVHSVALSSRDGAAQLHVPIGDDGVEHDASASLESTNEINSRNIDVPLRALDSFGFKDVALIKIDVEGHESNVIDGAQATLEATLPALIVEIEQRHNTRPIDSIFAQIEAFGYRGFFLLDGKMVPLSQFVLQKHQPIAALESSLEDYHNNFVFLNSAKIDEGHYELLLRSSFV